MEEMTIVENSQVAVSDNLPNKSLALTFFDSAWFHFPPLHSILSYKCPYADRTIIPNLKQSLSVALKYYFPLSGSLLLSPSTTSNLEIHYDKGDSISFIVAECNSDFEYFVGKDHMRSVNKIVSLLPHLPTLTKISDSVLAPVFAIQVTIFPNKGICLGFSWRHVVGDASTIVGFTKAWASIYKHGTDLPLLASDALPSYDRSLLPEFKELCQTFKIQQESKMQIKDFEVSMVDFSKTPSDLVRSSFILSHSNIQNLKTLLLAKHPTLGHVSSFVVTVGYFWSCLAKVRAKLGEDTSEDQMDYFLCAAECRARLDPPLPKTYFGNCVAPCFARIKSNELLGEEGFPNGAKTIGQAITNFAHKEGGILKDVENWMSDLYKTDFRRALSISGSPKFSRYDVDFGWGKPDKVDTGLNAGALSLEQSLDAKGGLEIGLCLPKDKMETLRGIFYREIESTRPACK